MRHKRKSKVEFDTANHSDSDLFFSFFDASFPEVKFEQTHPGFQPSMLNLFSIIMIHITPHTGHWPSG